MTQRQRHRGRHPEDERLFSGKCLPVLRMAVVDLSFLLTRAYARDAALQVVGDHYQLDARHTARRMLRAPSENLMRCPRKPCAGHGWSLTAITC
jgi:hypothetical protein